MYIFKSFLVMLFVGLLAIGETKAQVIHKKGKIVMSLGDVGGNLPNGDEVSGIAEMLKNIKMTTVFNESKTFFTQDMEMMGQKMDVKVLSELVNGEVNVYQTIMGVKIKTTSKIKNPDSIFKMTTPIVDRSSKKTILGFDCYQVKIAMINEGQTTTVDMYVTDAIKSFKILYLEWKCLS
jgi:hypothetical protein